MQPAALQQTLSEGTTRPPSNSQVALGLRLAFEAASGSSFAPSSPRASSRRQASPAGFSLDPAQCSGSADAIFSTALAQKGLKCEGRTPPRRIERISSALCSSGGLQTVSRARSFCSSSCNMRLVSPAEPFTLRMAAQGRMRLHASRCTAHWLFHASTALCASRSETNSTPLHPTGTAHSRPKRSFPSSRTRSADNTIAWSRFTWVSSRAQTSGRSAWQSWRQSLMRYVPPLQSTAPNVCEARKSASSSSQRNRASLSETMLSCSDVPLALPHLRSAAMALRIDRTFRADIFFSGKTTLGSFALT
mmetsp:Transcript_2686/g.6814  ORF Transcript_2686/g.6814 Transcript_2686/m.6814 type:complete len:305 (+) Transcript_2686:865-1779(+)